MQSSVFPSRGTDLVRELSKKQWVTSREARAVIKKYYPFSNLYVENSRICQDGWLKSYNMKAVFKRFGVYGLKTDSIAQDKYLWRTSDLQEMESFLFNNQHLVHTKNKVNSAAQVCIDRARNR